MYPFWKTHLWFALAGHHDRLAKIEIIHSKISLDLHDGCLNCFPLQSVNDTEFSNLITALIFLSMKEGKPFECFSMNFMWILVSRSSHSSCLSFIRSVNMSAVLTLSRFLQAEITMHKASERYPLVAVMIVMLAKSAFNSYLMK